MKVHKEMLGAQYIVAMARHRGIMSGIQERLAERYMGRFDGPDAYKCFDVLSEDMRTFADATRCDPTGWRTNGGVHFLALLDVFNKILNDAITIFLRGQRGEQDKEKFYFFS